MIRKKSSLTKYYRVRTKLTVFEKFRTFSFKVPFNFRLEATLTNIPWLCIFLTLIDFIGSRGPF